MAVLTNPIFNKFLSHKQIKTAATAEIPHYYSPHINTWKTIQCHRNVI